MAQIRQIRFELFFQDRAGNEQVLSSSSLPVTAKIKRLPSINASLDENAATEYLELQRRHVIALRLFMPANVRVEQRAASLPLNEDTLSRSSTPSGPHRSYWLRACSNALLDVAPDSHCSNASPTSRSCISA